MRRSLTLAALLVLPFLSGCCGHCWHTFWCRPCLFGGCGQWCAGHPGAGCTSSFAGPPPVAMPVAPMPAYPTAAPPTMPVAPPQIEKLAGSQTVPTRIVR